MVPDTSDGSAKAEPPPADKELLANYQRGDVSALALLVQRHEVRLARIAYRITGSSHEAEDIRSTVLLRFLQLVRLLQSTDGSGKDLENVGGWLTRCTVNEAISRERSKERETHVLTDVARQPPPECRDGSVNQTIDDEASAGLFRALAQMTVDERTLLSLRFDDDLTFREMAEILERPASTIKTQLSRIIHRLRELLSPTP